jgi:hypothetical protein
MTVTGWEPTARCNVWQNGSWMALSGRQAGDNLASGLLRWWRRSGVLGMDVHLASWQEPGANAVGSGYNGQMLQIRDLQQEALFHVTIHMMV